MSLESGTMARKASMSLKSPAASADLAVGIVRLRLPMMPDVHTSLLGGNSEMNGDG
jgi:hypothetical protein